MIRAAILDNDLRSRCADLESFFVTVTVINTEESVSKISCPFKCFLNSLVLSETGSDVIKMKLCSTSVHHKQNCLGDSHLNSKHVLVVQMMGIWKRDEIFTGCYRMWRCQENELKDN